MVTLERAVALAMVDGPDAGLDLLATLDDRLPGHYRLAAVRVTCSSARGVRARPPTSCSRLARHHQPGRAGLPARPGGRLRHGDPGRRPDG